MTPMPSGSSGKWRSNSRSDRGKSDMMGAPDRMFVLCSTPSVSLCHRLPHARSERDKSSANKKKSYGH
jgi:hypothetical protein